MTMATNTHDPVRHPDESLEQYDSRRVASRLIHKIETNISTHPKPRRNRKEIARAAKSSGYTPPAKRPKERKRKPQGKPVIGARKRLVNVDWKPTPKAKS